MDNFDRAIGTGVPIQYELDVSHNFTILVQDANTFSEFGNAAGGFNDFRNVGTWEKMKIFVPQ